MDKKYYNNYFNNLAYLFIGKFLKSTDKLKFAKLIALALIITTITSHSRNIINGYWNISDNLPCIYVVFLI